MGDSNIPVLKPGVDIARPDKAQPEIDAATQKLYADSLPKTVQITTNTSRGSGFFMDKDGTIGTAAHVVMGTREQFATTADGSTYKLQIEKLDDINDTAILRPVGLKPGTRPFVQLGTSSDLKAGEAVFPMGHPEGLRPAYISPGSFSAQITQNDLLIKLNPDNKVKIEEGLRKLTESESVNARAALDRQLVSTVAHIRSGDSGGPAFDASGKLIGVNDLITNHESAFLVPVEKMRDLYESKDSKFQFTYSRLAEPWVQDYKNTWLNKPFVASTETLAAGGLGYIGFRAATRYPRAIGAAATFIEGARLFDDAGSLLSSTDSRDRLKFAISSASDLAGVVGGLALMTSRYRVGGAIGLSVGIAGRLAADFLPNHLVLTDIQRKSNPLLPPMNQDLEKLLGL